MEQKNLRFGHSDGQTEACFDESGRYIISCGSDGEVRIWDGFDDDDPVSHHISESAYSVTVKGDKIYASLGNKTVHSYSFPDGEPDSIIARFTDISHHIHCDLNGKYLAMGSGDFQIKVAEIGTQNKKTLSGHNAPVLSVAVDPLHEYVASSSCDGTVKIWSLESQECLESWNLLPKSNDYGASKTQARISWHSTKGTHLAVPVNNEINIYKRMTWNLETVLKDSCFTEMVCVTAFSFCGKYLAASSFDGKIVVWDFSTKTVLHRNKHLRNLGICCLTWRPKEQLDLLYTDNHGQMGILENIDVLGKKTTDDTNIAQDNFADIFANDDSFGDPDSPVHLKHKKNLNKIEDNEDDSNAIDIGAIKAVFEPKIFGSEEKEAINKTEGTKESTVKEIVQQKVPLNVQQPAFQPGSSPIHYQHRYMLWNNIGIVRRYNTDEENSIDIEFHDTSIHHSMHLTNSMGHTMAALSEDGLVLACPIDTETSSKLVCHHFGTWDSNREWMVEMPEEEQIEAVALGKNCVFCVTNQYFLRLFTIGGVQLAVYSIPGPVVSLSCYDKTLVVAYHHSAGLEDSQDLGILTYSFHKGKLIQRSSQVLPLSPKSTLSWLGYTDEGTVCTVDSKGVIRLLINNLWMPILNTKENIKGKSDTYFVVGLSEITQQIRCILCKGARYPPTLPKPSLAVLPFKVPFCELSTEKGRFEEEHCRYSYLTVFLEKLLKDDFEVDAELDISKRKVLDNLMKLFALSARSEREYRALEVGRLMPSSRGVQGAIQYAMQSRCIALAEKLGEVAYQKQQEEMGELCESEEESEEQDVIANSPAKTALNSRLANRNESSIKPKPLSDSFSNSHKSNINGSLIDAISDHSHLDSGESNDEELERNTKSPLVPEKKNPFQISSQKKKSIGGIDSILQNSLDEKNCQKKSMPVAESNMHMKKSKNSKVTNGASKKRKAEKQVKECEEMPKTKAPKTSKDVSANTAKKISSFLFNKD